MKTILTILGLVIPCFINELPPPDLNNKCLSSAIFLEARGEGVKGMIAVSEFIKRESMTTHKNICQVMAKKGRYASYGKAYLNLVFDVGDKYNLIDKIVLNQAILIANSQNNINFPNSDYYITKALYKKHKQKWLKGLKTTAIIGNHVFLAKN
jgi:hypothetical protein